MKSEWINAHPSNKDLLSPYSMGWQGNFCLIKQGEYVLLLDKKGVMHIGAWEVSQEINHLGDTEYYFEDQNGNYIDADYYLPLPKQK